jgi:cellulose biosynthesis protein BcsQ
MEGKKPKIVSFISGKGGVGKTMLAVSFARELSFKTPTLIFDMDFFNRGLTGLLPVKKEIETISKPEFLKCGEDVQDDWKIVEADKNLFHISYPDMTDDEMRLLAAKPVIELADEFKEFILNIASKLDCAFVVLDCHGGPDNASFAACLISDHTLMISEPDRVTLYGTLNFIRQLERIKGDRTVDLRLVYNKVLRGFSGLFLRGFYNRTIKQDFGGKPLLAIVPMEMYLTKQFEKHPFLTYIFPYSLLAKKTRLIIRDLFYDNSKDLLSPNIRQMPKFVRIYRMLTLGNMPRILSKDVVMIIIVILALIAGLFHYIGKKMDFRSEFTNFNNNLIKLQVLSNLLEKGNLKDIFAECPKIHDYLVKENKTLYSDLVTTHKGKELDPFELYFLDKHPDFNFESELNQNLTLKELDDNKIGGEYFRRVFNSKINNIQDFKKWRQEKACFSKYQKELFNIPREDSSYSTENSFKPTQVVENIKQYKDLIKSLDSNTKLDNEFFQLISNSKSDYRKIRLPYILIGYSHYYFKEYGAETFALLALWLAAILFYEWTSYGLDRKFTFNSRLGIVSGMWSFYLLLVAWWSFISFFAIKPILEGFFNYVYEIRFKSHLDYGFFLSCLIIIIWLCFIIKEAVKLRGLFYDGPKTEIVLRTIFVAIIIFLPWVFLYRVEWF